MKRAFGMILMVSLLLPACAASHMVARERAPELKPAPDGALLVIVRDAFMGGGVAMWNYLDGKLIGETKGKTYFVTRVAQGPHYVIARSENTSPMLFNFEAGKTYYLRQDTLMGAWRASTGYSPLKPDEAKTAIAECSYWELDPANPGEDLAPADFEQAKLDYAQAIKEDPEGYKSLLEYRGF